MKRRAGILAMAALLLGFGLAACRPPRPAPAGAAKLDADLRQLVAGTPRPAAHYDVAQRPDGTRVYGVLLLVDGSDDLRAAGIPFDSVQGDVVTARLTVDEIVRAAALPSVRAIRNASRVFPQ